MEKNNLSHFLSDGLVIQRDASFPVWSEKKACVTFLGKIYESKETDGKWLVNLDPVQAGGPFTIKIDSDGITTVINDVYAGDVWLCAGQSNMEMEMQSLKEKYPEEWEKFKTGERGSGAGEILIRHFRVPKVWDFNAPCDDVSGGKWTPASKETLNEFSGTAWFFAKYIYEKHGVPIGLINTAWGGTPVEAWMSEDALKNFPEKIEESKSYRYPEKREEAFKKSGYVTEEFEYFFAQRPIGDFNAMLCPVLKYPLKGVIWYQGESNDSAPQYYSQLFKLMIEDWRKLSRKEDLPFLFVQLPVWKEASDNNENSAWAILREAQASALELVNTGMACALELGDWDDIHPLNKKDVGYRLYLAAEKVLFGADNTSPGPVLRKVKKEDLEIKNGKIFIYFDNCGDGLCVFNDPQTIKITTNAFLRTSEISESFSDNNSKAYISVMGGSGGYVRLPAEIEKKDCISIDLSSVKNPRTILYAWADNPKDRQLFNSDGLPVIPFKINI
ncbi:MAG: sialate O-acetylesterase [Treponema sp.]|nr:sialate O-acetylesterase [Treponema sp.]